MVRDAYFKYYGPLLTAARIKEHAYLQLKSKEDYTYFFHETSKKYSALLILMADDARDQDDTLFNEWILAVEHFYSITDCEREMIDSDDDDDEELPYGYNVLRWKITFESEEVLASSQLDLITIMFQQYRSYGTSPVQQQTSPHVSLYGYYHDALRRYWLDAMISVINQQCDVVFDEEYEVEFFRTMESSEEVYEDPVNFVSLLCLDFGIGSCDYVREQLERRLEIAPSFSALLAYDQQMLDKISVHMIEQYCQVQNMELKILAFYFKEFLEHSFYSEVAMLKLRQVLSYDQLKVFCSEFDQDQIAALHLGDQFQEPWIIEVERLSKQVGFPENISQIVHLCNLNSNNQQRLPQCALNVMARVISNIVVMQPEGSTSRYWFFEGVPLSVIKERRVLRTYIQIWPLASRVSESLRVSAVEELARGLFHYMESNNVVPKVRVQLIKLIQDEAQMASQHGLAYEVSRLKEMTQCKEVGGVPREE
ncbi:hypothetical protein MP228_012752 [Amoeboaphelidium protococcarum]|nr:hypothetical protein MP228_012752 [Amoeboaphelidium protococcarum]